MNVDLIARSSWYHKVMKETIDLVLMQQDDIRKYLPDFVGLSREDLETHMFSFEHLCRHYAQLNDLYTDMLHKSNFIHGEIANE